MCLPITAAAWPGPLVHHQPAPWPAATRDGLQALASQMVTAGFPWAGNEPEQTSRCSWGGWGCHDAGGRRARTWQNTRIYEVTSEEPEGRTSCEGSEMRKKCWSWGVTESSEEQEMVLDFMSEALLKATSDDSVCDGCLKLLRIKWSLYISCSWSKAKV